MTLVQYSQQKKPLSCWTWHRGRSQVKSLLDPPLTFLDWWTTHFYLSGETVRREEKGAGFSSQPGKWKWRRIILFEGKVGGENPVKDVPWCISVTRKTALSKSPYKSWWHTNRINPVLHSFWVQGSGSAQCTPAALSDPVSHPVYVYMHMQMKITSGGSGLQGQNRASHSIEWGLWIIFQSGGSQGLFRIWAWWQPQAQLWKTWTRGWSKPWILLLEFLRSLVIGWGTEILPTGI